MKSFKDVFHVECEKLQFFCESITDCHHSSPVFLPHGKHVVRNFNIKNGRMLLDNVFFTNNSTFEQRVSRAKPEAGDLIITREAPMGEVCIIPEGVECCLGQRMVLIKPDLKKVDKQFLLYALLSDYSQTQIHQSNGTGSIVSNLRIPVLKALRVPNLKLPTQKFIGKTLGAIDKKIELNIKINEELEAMAKLIYEYWFVQFDFPINNGKPYKSSGGKMVYNELLKREIPDGWEVNSFGKYFSVKKGELITKDTIQEGFVKVVAAGLSFSYLHSTPNYKKNTITVSSSGASAGFVNFWREPIFASDCITVRGLTDTDTLFALHYLKLIQQYIFRQAIGSAQPHVYPDDISGLKYLEIPKKLIEEFGNMTLSLNEKISINIAENENLIALRDWLLPMLMNGQVTFNDS
jgi:type I restriction enzyme, S subunit